MLLKFLGTNELLKNIFSQYVYFSSQKEIIYNSFSFVAAMIAFKGSDDYSFSAIFGMPEDFLYSNGENFYSMGTLVLCNSSSVLRNCAISLAN